jgi:hypothetical protein
MSFLNKVQVKYQTQAAANDNPYTQDWDELVRIFGKFATHSEGASKQLFSQLAIACKDLKLGHKSFAAKRFGYIHDLAKQLEKEIG